MSRTRRVVTMRKPIALSLALCLMAATAAHAQYGGGLGGGGGGGGGHRHGGGGGGGGGGSSSPSQGPARPAQKPMPVSDTDIIGVVKAIDPASGRITIAYEPVLVRNWPAGTMPFVVAKPDLLTAATVGEKVRFKLDIQQIIELGAY